MKNGIEIRPNGVKITKKMGNAIMQYHVDGSANGPWDYLWSARRDADDLTGRSDFWVTTRQLVRAHSAADALAEFKGIGHVVSCDKVASNEKV